MIVQREGQETWLNVFAPQEILEQTDEGGSISQAREQPVLFVDIGGLGHQCRALRSFLPSSLSADIKILFQDLPDVIIAIKG